MRARQVDGGATWGPVGIAAGGASALVGNPDAVATRDGRVVLLYVTHSAKCNGDCGTGNGMVVSTDDGVSFGPPASIGAMFGPASGSLPGPGVALQSSTGRLLVISHHSAYQRDYVTVSDDGGSSWHTVNHTFPGMDEAQITQLANGSLLANMRHRASPKLGRAVAVSCDDGNTWGPISFDKALISPVCQGSIVTFNNVTYFSNPRSTSGRNHLTVQRSDDDGATWDHALLIQPGPSAGYSCLVKGEVKPGAGGILFEGPVAGELLFALFPTV